MTTQISQVLSKNIQTSDSFSPLPPNCTVYSQAFSVNAFRNAQAARKKWGLGTTQGFAVNHKESSSLTREKFQLSIIESLV